MSTMIHFDTLQYTKTLCAAGIPEEHAEAMAAAQKATLAECLDTTLATKADMAATKADIQAVRTELKADIQDVRIELVAIEHRLESKATKEDVQDVRSELAGVASNVKVLAWMMSVLLACMGSLMTKAFL